MLSAGVLPRTQWGVFTAFPQAPVVDEATLRQEGENKRGTEGRKPTNRKSMPLITSHVAQNIVNILLNYCMYNVRQFMGKTRCMYTTA